MPLHFTQAAGVLTHAGGDIPLNSSVEDSRKSVTYLGRCSPSPLGFFPGPSIHDDLSRVTNVIALRPLVAPTSLVQYRSLASCAPDYSRVLKGVMQNLLQLLSVVNPRPELMAEITRHDVIRQAGGVLFSSHVLQRCGKGYRQSCTNAFKSLVSSADSKVSIQHIFSLMAHESHNALRGKPDAQKRIAMTTDDFFVAMSVGVGRIRDTRNVKGSCRDWVVGQYTDLSGTECFYENAAERCINDFVSCFKKGR